MRKLLAFFTLAFVLLTAAPASALWVGYESNAGDYPIVAWAKVTIPWFNCDGLPGDAMIAPWVGVSVNGTLDGRDIYLVQTGSTMYCNRQTGSKWVSVWYENWTIRPFNIPGVTAKPGDTLRYEVEVHPHQTIYDVRNLTTGESWTDSFPIEMDSKPYERDWIAECYQGANWDQPNHGVITFVKGDGFPNTAKPTDSCKQDKVTDLYAGGTKFDVKDIK